MTQQYRLLIRDLRLARELSQEELAQALHTSRQSIISLERGEYLPSFPLLVALMNFFDCNVNELIGGLKKEENKKGGEQPMQLAPWSPFSAIDRMHQEMNDMVERTFSRGDWSQSLSTSAGAINIHETDKEYEIDVQAPGFSEDDLTIEMTEDMLIISGAKKQEAEKKENRNVIRREFSHTEFSRSIRFASPIKENEVEAKLEKGTLKIIAPKIEPVKPKVKKIEVKRG